jgi:hypothetical protein
MSTGFIAYKWLGWGGAALLAGAIIMPSTTTATFNALKSTMQSRPGLLKKTASSGGGTTSGSTTGTTTTGTTTTTSTTGTTSATYTELSIIPSNFDVNSELVDAPIPGSSAGDQEGAFRFVCNAGQVLADDPIVFPGQPGKSHLHQFYGNTSANAYSTYSSLRTTGQSTCVSPLNRSAYWMPALLDGKGNVVRPDYVTIYYKRRPASDPIVSDPTAPMYQGKAVPLPNGLRFIFGWDPTGMNSARTGAAWFNCDGPTGTPGRYNTLTEAMAVCPAGNRVGAVIFAPDCWDGKNLDSADHRSHMAYASYGSWGYLKCDANHPYVIPTFTLGAWYTIAPGDDTSKWHFSSDEMVPGAPPGYTFHADWFGAWDNTAMSMWTDNCINKELSCSSGNLGNGKMMKMFSGFSWTANPRLVPVPQ